MAKRKKTSKKKTPAKRGRNTAHKNVSVYIGEKENDVAEVLELVCKRVRQKESIFLKALFLDYLANKRFVRPQDREGRHEGPRKAARTA